MKSLNDTKQRIITSDKWIFLSPLIIMLLIMIVYYLKGIYPFGNGNVSYYDLAQSETPLCYYTYDVLHGNKSCFYDWYSGLGTSMIDTAGNYIFNPVNLFFLLVKRNKILESMSLFLMIKLMIAAFSMSFYVSKKVRNQKIWMVFSGVLYASCGYFVQYYTTIHFLDIAIIFPLIMWAYDRMVKQGKNILYILLMAVGFMTNIYMMFMVSIYLILDSLFLISEYDDKKKMVFRLGKCTMLALMLSAFTTIPAVLQLLQSKRIANTNSTGYKDILMNVICQMQEQKTFMFYGSEVVIALVILEVITKKKTLKKYRKSLLMVLALVVPALIESTNILWHTGSYQHFPMRFGYILTFQFIDLATEILFDEVHFMRVNEKIGSVAKIFSIAMLPMVVMVLKYFLQGFQEYGIRELKYYHAYGLIALLLVIYYMLVLAMPNKKHVFVLIGIMLICQAFFAYYGFIAPEKVYSLECTNDVVLKTELLKDTMKIESDPLSRVKNSDTSLNANYPFVLERGAISNWTWGTVASLQDQLKKMGYSTNYTRLLDSGGTIFTDALLGIKNVITKEELDVNLYSCIEKSEEGNYYSCCYQLPFGCIMENDINLEEEEIINKFEYQNKLFRNITGIDQSLIITYNIDDLVTSQRINESSNSYQLQIPITNKSVLYIYSFDDANEKYEFQINGQKKEIPFLSVEDNYVYPAAFNNGLLECGVYENEVVELDINVYGEDLRNLMVGSLDLKLFEQGIDQINSSLSIEASAGKASLGIKGKAEKDGILFLPIGYNDGWNAIINGKKVNVMPVISGSFCGISMQKGEFELELNYVPKGFMIGILLSIVSLILLLFMIIMKKENRSDENIGILTVGFNITFYLLAIGIIIFIYVLPIIAWTVVKVVEIWLFGI